MNENSLEQTIDVRDIWRIISKRKWIIISIFLIVVSFMTLKTYKQRPVYQAMTRILIDKQYPNVVSFQEVMRLSADRGDYYETQFKILKSKSIIRKVINKLDLHNSPEFLPDPDVKRSFSLMKLLYDIKNWVFNMIMPPKDETEFEKYPTKEEIEVLRENRLIRRVIGSVKIKPIKKSRLADIRVTGHHPEIIAKIADTVAREYITYNLEVRLDASGEAVTWLNERLKVLKQKVESSHMALQRYKEKVKIISFEEKQNIVDQKLAQLNSALTSAKTGRIKIETVYRYFQKNSTNSKLVESIPAVIENTLIQKLKINLATRQEKYSEFSKTYGSKHPKIIQVLTQIESLQSRINSEIKNIHNGIRAEYQVALAEEKSLSKALEDQKKEVAYQHRMSIKIETLKRETETNEQMYTLLLKRLKETGLSSGLRSNNVRIIDLADVPQTPIGPKKKRNFMLAILLGLFLGVMTAFFVEYIDNTIKEPDEIPMLFQIPFLGLLGHYSDNSKKSFTKTSSSISPKLVSIHDPSSNISESLRTIRTNLIFSSNYKAHKTIMVTSAVPAEGKSTLSSNLAVVMASLGEKVLLIDSDLRKPVIHKLFNLKKTPGLSNYLIGKKSAKEVIHKTDVEGLHIIPSGPTPPNPSELVSHPQFKVLCDTATETFDYIILDSPPVASVSDPMIISSIADAVVIVVRCGVTTKNSVSKAVKQLRNINANIIGAILNDVDFRKDSYYYQYYYKHYYYKDDEKA